jgi:hypothetical protein
MRGRHALVLSAIIVVVHVEAARAQSAAAPLSASDVATSCAPTQTMTAGLPALRVIGAQGTAHRSVFGRNEIVVVNGGSEAGIQLGQTYFIRRPHVFGPTRPKTAPRTINTAGSLRIVSLNRTTALAEIDMVCDAVFAGDYLEPFTRPVAVASTPDVRFSTLDFSSLARVMFGAEERRTGGAGAFMLLEGGKAGLGVGSRVAVYRDFHIPGVPLTAIAEGLIMSMASGTPLMQITEARDAVQSGDYVVPHR